MGDVSLICGAAGFLGTYAAGAFERSGWQVVRAGRSGSPVVAAGPQPAQLLEGDFADPDFVTRLLREAQPACIVFVAGPSDVQKSFDDPLRDFVDHMLPLVQVLDGARRLQHPPGVLLVSSAAVYGNPASIPVAEGALPSPISPYGFHKLQQELLLDEFTKLYGLPTCKARVFSTYGAGLRHLAVWDIARRAMNRDYTLRGTGAESRDYLHVSDVARALAAICRHAPFEGECINVASGEEHTIKDVATLVYEAIGVAARPRFEGSEVKGNPIRWRADVQRLAALGFSPAVPFASGIAETVGWISANA